MKRIQLFHEALDRGLQALGRENTLLKEEQYEAFKAIVVDKKDRLVTLPTGFGKSLIYQLLPHVFEFIDFHIQSSVRHSTIVVVSPLNALMRDQMSKLKGFLTCLC